jgi:hypothetical protein
MHAQYWKVNTNASAGRGPGIQIKYLNGVLTPDSRPSRRRWLDVPSGSGVRIRSFGKQTLTPSILNFSTTTALAELETVTVDNMNFRPQRT